MTRLKLFLLGSPRAEVDGMAIDINRRKAIALLAYLGATRQGHSRESLTAFLWPDVEQSRAFAYLRTILWTLNKSGEWVTAERDLVSIQPDVWVDVGEFRTFSKQKEINEKELTEAASLYRGDFMAGFTLDDAPAFEEWQLFESESLRREMGGVLQQLTDLLFAREAYETAIPYARRWLALDSLHEPAHRQLMRLYAANGQRSLALRQYEECLSILQAELGVEPEPETTALLHELQEKRLSVHTPSMASLPTPATELIAREQELTEIMRLLDDPACRLVTLMGTGGIGKTRLALEVAAQSHYTHGVYFIPLAPVSDAHFLVPAIADVIHFKTYNSGDEPKTQLLSYLSEKNMLLVLDNFEHLLDGAALLAEVLASAPSVKLLVTSRERLYLQEEWIYEVQGLGYPASETVENLDLYGAVQLFMQSARRVRPDFALHNGERTPVARICRLVEGMPLAVELAAAWLPVLSPDGIADEIERCLDFLEAPLRNLPPRHRSVRAVFESSWERLTPDEQSILSKLSVFRGGFTREAAQAVAAASLPALMSLLGKSLLRRSLSGRFEIHELLRQFASEKLIEARQNTLNRHSEYFATFLKIQENGIKNRQQIESLNAVEAEIDNVRTAWRQAAEQHQFGVIRDMLPALALFYDMRSRVGELRELLERAIYTPMGEAEQATLAFVLIYAAATCSRLNEHTKSQEYYERAAAILQPLEQPELAAAFVMGGLISFWRPDSRQKAEIWVRRGLRMAESSGDQWVRASALRALGDMAHHIDVDYVESGRSYQQALETSRSIGDYWGESAALKSLGEVAYSLGDFALAEERYREGLALSESLNDRNGIAWAANRTAVMLSAQGKFNEALELARLGVDISRQLGDWGSMAWGLFDIGEILVAQQRYEEAESIFRQSLDAFHSVGAGQGPGWVWSYQSRAALATGYPQRAKELALEALTQMDKYDNVWSKAAARYALGEALIALGEYEAARGYLIDSVMLARQVQAVMQMLRHLVGVARLLAHTGDTARALELLAFIMVHPVSWQETKDWAGRLFEELTAELTPESVDAARERAKSLTLDEIVTRILPETSANQSR